MNFSLTKLQIFLSRDAATKKKVQLVTAKISFILFLTDGCQQIEYIMLVEKNKKSEKLSFLAFVPPQGLEPWTPTLRVSCSTN